MLMPRDKMIRVTPPPIDYVTPLMITTLPPRRY